jgi:isocitrate dehydrogenase
MKPEQFDIILTTNMNGDILSDLTSGLVGGLGFAPSANIGNSTAMFEAVHGSAPDIAGKDLANPTALMLSSVMLLRHIGQPQQAQALENAVLVTLEDGRTLTGDIAREHAPVGTTAFTDAVIANLGRTPASAPRRESRAMKLPDASWRPAPVTVQHREVVGADVFVEHDATDPNVVGTLMETCAPAGCGVELKMVSNRGTQVYPGGSSDTDVVDVWRVRFVRSEGSSELTDDQLTQLLLRVSKVARWMHVEKLQRFDGERAYSLAQGEA